MGRNAAFGRPQAHDRVRRWWYAKSRTSRSNVLLSLAVGTVALGLIMAATSGDSSRAGRGAGAARSGAPFGSVATTTSTSLVGSLFLTEPTSTTSTTSTTIAATSTVPPATVRAATPTTRSPATTTTVADPGVSVPEVPAPTTTSPPVVTTAPPTTLPPVTAPPTTVVSPGTTAPPTTALGIGLPPVLGPG